MIIATGASALWLNLESEQRLRGRGVSACATCDGFFFRDREIAVVGGGDSAMEEANYLTQFASKVHLLHRRDGFRASKIMIDRTYAHPKIEVHTNTEVAEVLGDTKVEGLRLRDTRTGKERDLPMEGLFIAIGHKPNTDVFRDWLDVDEKGYLVAHDHTNSRIEGVFIAGDVQDHRYRQAVTAAGDGCRAAIDAERWLEAQGIAEASDRHRVVTPAPPGPMSGRGTGMRSLARSGGRRTPDAPLGRLRPRPPRAPRPDRAPDRRVLRALPVPGRGRAGRDHRDQPHRPRQPVPAQAADRRRHRRAPVRPPEPVRRADDRAPDRDRG